MQPSFVHLRLHSEFSIVDGIVRIDDAVAAAKADGMPALALTDTDNMFGALEFSDKMAGYGIQPIVGCEVAVDFGDVDPNTRSILATTGPTRIVLLAARERGYQNLMRLNSRAFLETPVSQSSLMCGVWF
ncbi:MAG: PHP domain-containing protein, partial [Bradyrhizobium sp.]